MSPLKIKDESLFLKAFFGSQLGAFSKIRTAARSIYFDPDASRGQDDKIECPLVETCLIWLRDYAKVSDINDYEAISRGSPLQKKTSFAHFLTLLFFELLQSRAARQRNRQEAIERIEYGLLYFWEKYSGSTNPNLAGFLSFLSEAASIEALTKTDIIEARQRVLGVLSRYLGLVYFPLKYVELGQVSTWIPRQEKFDDFTMDEWVIGLFAETKGIQLPSYNSDEFLEKMSLRVLAEFLQQTDPYPNNVPAEISKKFIPLWKSGFIEKVRILSALHEDLENENVRMFVVFPNGKVTDIKKDLSAELTPKENRILLQLASHKKIGFDQLVKLCEIASVPALQTAVSTMKKKLLNEISCGILTSEEDHYTLLEGVRLFHEKRRTDEQTHS